MRLSCPGSYSNFLMVTNSRGLEVLELWSHALTKLLLKVINEQKDRKYF